MERCQENGRLISGFSQNVTLPMSGLLPKTPATTLILKPDSTEFPWNIKQKSGFTNNTRKGQEKNCVVLLLVAMTVGLRPKSHSGTTEFKFYVHVM